MTNQLTLTRAVKNSQIGQMKRWDHWASENINYLTRKFAKKMWTIWLKWSLTRTCNWVRPTSVIVKSIMKDLARSSLKPNRRSVILMWVLLTSKVSKLKIHSWWRKLMGGVHSVKVFLIITQTTLITSDYSKILNKTHSKTIWI